MTAPWVHWLGVVLQVAGLVLTAFGLYRTSTQLQPDKTLTRWIRDQVSRLSNRARHVSITASDLSAIASMEAAAVVTPGLTGDYEVDRQLIIDRFAAVSADMNSLATKASEDAQALKELVDDVSSTLTELDEKYESRINAMALDGLKFGAGGVVLVAIGLLVAEFFRV